jgi:ADP-ribose pyrophosphatase
MVPGYSDEVLYFYLADGLTEVGFSPDEDEYFSIIRYSIENVLAMIERNEIEDAKTIIGVLSYLTRIIP